MPTKIGHVTREPGYLYYVDGTGAVMRTPMRGHKGVKSKVAQFKRLEKSLCYVAGNGDVFCRKR